MATYADTSDFRDMSRSMVASSTANDSVLHGSLNMSHNTSIRPLTAAYKAASSENQVRQRYHSFAFVFWYVHLHCMMCIVQFYSFSRVSCNCRDIHT